MGFCTENGDFNRENMVKLLPREKSNEVSNFYSVIQIGLKLLFNFLVNWFYGSVPGWTGSWCMSNCFL